MCCLSNFLQWCRVQQVWSNERSSWRVRTQVWVENDSSKLCLVMSLTLYKVWSELQKQQRSIQLLLSIWLLTEKIATLDWMLFGERLKINLDRKHLYKNCYVINQHSVLGLLLSIISISVFWFFNKFSFIKSNEPNEVPSYSSHPSSTVSNMQM